MKKSQVLNEVKEAYFRSSGNIGRLSAEAYRAASQIANAVSLSSPENILASVGVSDVDISEKKYRVESIAEARLALENVLAYLNMLKQQKSVDSYGRNIAIAYTHIEDGLLRVIPF